MNEIIELEPIYEHRTGKPNLENNMTQSQSEKSIFKTDEHKIYAHVTLLAVFYIISMVPLVALTSIQKTRELITLPILISLIITITLSQILNLVIILTHNLYYGRLTNFILTIFNTMIIAFTVLFCYKVSFEPFGWILIPTQMFCLIIFIHNWYLILFVHPA